MLLSGSNFLENLFYSFYLTGISMLGCCVGRAGLLVVDLSSYKMGLKVGPCIFSSGFAVPFSNKFAKIDAFVMMILTILIPCSSVSVMPCASTILV